MRDFIISGTGQVVRPGDRIVIHPRSLTEGEGAGILLQIMTSGLIKLELDSGGTVITQTSCVMREDDPEPLWIYS